VYRFEKFSGNFWEKSGYLWYMEKMIKKVLKEYVNEQEVYSDDAMTIELLRKAKEHLKIAHRYIESAAQYALNLDGGSELATEIMDIKKDIVYGSVPGLEPDESSCNIVGRITDIINQSKSDI
jgi:hypothetical protein